ncbi:MAG TPA: hypothetical protein VEL11_08250 [Candidatus Bathyarchaeia archaeon]|nr:hypothetical protein [Candidatus Bathyarchaeia archaeon]
MVFAVAIPFDMFILSSTAVVTQQQGINSNTTGDVLPRLLHFLLVPYHLTLRQEAVCTNYKQDTSSLHII